MAKTLTPSAAKKDVVMEVELGEELPTIEADPVRLRQVLFNLAENAVKFSPRGGRVVVGARTVELASEDDDEMGFVLMAAPERAVELSVKDTGPGIPQAEQERIFDAFYQVDGSSTREHGGTGLGLSIVKRLVDAHGGRVWVESAPGEGATFRLTIPESAAEE